MTHNPQPTANKRILVTGGAGYIGSHMVYLLLQNGYQPVVVDNFSNSDRQNITSLEKLMGVEIEVIELDLALAIDQLLVKNIDAVIHFAALKAVGESMREPLRYYHNNVAGTINLLNWAQQNGVKKFIFSSTAAVYNDNQSMPLNEQSQANPASVYGRTKLFAESVVRDAAATYGIDAVIFRYFNVAGNVATGEIGEPKGSFQNLIPALIASHLGIRPFKLQLFGTDYDTRDGTAIRDYIHVLDLVDAHFRALSYLADHPGVHLFNLGRGQGTTVKEIIEAFERVSGSKLAYDLAPRRPGDAAVSYADASAARRELGWESSHNINDIMNSAWKWYQRMANKP